jgi:alpha-glucosidase
MRRATAQFFLKKASARGAAQRVASAVLLLTLLAPPAKIQAQDTIEVASPEGVVSVSFEIDDGVPTYRVARLGQEVIAPSRLGVALNTGASLAQDLSLVDIEQTSFDETWTQVWGEKKNIRNNCNELRATVETISDQPLRMVIVFRVYDDDVGFRYEWPEPANLDAFEITDEVTEFVLPGDHIAWWVPAYGRFHYEYLWQETAISAINPTTVVHTPLTMETADGLFLSLHEAALVDYSSMSLARTGDHTLKADLAPWGRDDGFILVEATTSHVSPWRTLQIGDGAGELITSYLILNLNEPNKLEEVSWIQPQKYIGIWWEMHLGTSTWHSGPDHGATTENAKRYIDFGAEHGIPNVLIEGWNTGWEGRWCGSGVNMNFTEAHPDFDIEEVARYAASKGVSIIGHHETGGAIPNYESQMDDALAMYEKLGVPAVKTGYVDFGRQIEHTDESGKTQYEWHYGQYMVRHHQQAIEAFARHKIMLNIHEPVKDTGLRRTWPHVMTREGARGQEYNSPGGGGNPPDYTTILPFTRLLSGPMDFTPGIFDLDHSGDEPAHWTPSTLANQLALYVVLYSPLQMAADLPSNYEKNPDAFQFIKYVPVLHASIGNFVTIVRKDRDSDEWYLGSITDEVGRVLAAPLWFLDPGQDYVAEIYRDGAEADWQERPLDIEITSVLVDSSTQMSLRLAPAGGQAIRFRPATDEETNSLSRYGQED